jgi:hypothetical protein
MNHGIVKTDTTLKLCLEKLRTRISPLSPRLHRRVKVFPQQGINSTLVVCLELLFEKAPGDDKLTNSGNINSPIVIGGG